MSFEVRPCGDLAEFGKAFMAIGQYFGQEPDPVGGERFSRLIPIERMHAAWDDGEIVGGAGAFPFRLSVPGGTLPCGVRSHARFSTVRHQARAGCHETRRGVEPRLCLRHTGLSCNNSRVRLRE